MKYWLGYKKLKLWRWVFYKILEGGYENNVRRIGRRWFTQEEAERTWKHHGKWYTKFVQNRINPTT
jgi:hypothetical protein